MVMAVRHSYFQMSLILRFIGFVIKLFFAFFIVLFLLACYLIHSGKLRQFYLFIFKLNFELLARWNYFYCFNKAKLLGISTIKHSNCDRYCPEVC